MRPNIKRGSGFRGILNYCLAPQKAAEIVGGNMCGRTPRDLSAEFGLICAIRPGCQRPVWHCSLSLSDNERIDPGRWGIVAERFVEEMGLAEHQWVSVRHSDADHDHTHLIVNRVGVDGRIASLQNDAKLAQSVCQKIEKELGLTLTYCPPESAPKTPGFRIKKQELEMWERRGKLPPKAWVAAEIEAALKDKPALPDFLRTLEVRGIVPRIYHDAACQPRGLSFAVGSDIFSGSQVGKKYGWKALSARLNQAPMDPAAVVRWAVDPAVKVKVGGLACEPPEERLKISAAAYKAHLFRLLVGHDATPLRYVRRLGNGDYEAVLISGQRMVDSGDRITLLGRADERAIRSTVSAFEARSWKSVELFGSDEFRCRCLAECIRRGIAVVNPELANEQSRLTGKVAAVDIMETENGADIGHPAASEPRSVDAGQDGPGGDRAAGGEDSTSEPRAAIRRPDGANSTAAVVNDGHSMRSGGSGQCGSDILDDDELISALRRLERARSWPMEDRVNGPADPSPGGI